MDVEERKKVVDEFAHSAEGKSGRKLRRLMPSYFYVI
jgi:hypothetical protein